MTRWRYRPYQALAVIVLSALVTACAVFAPLYDRAMQQALTQVTLERAPLLGRSIVSTATLVGQQPDLRIPRPEQLADRMPADFGDDFEPAVLGYDANSWVLPAGVRDPHGELLWRSGQCDHLTFLKGQCPEAPGEIAVSRADVQHFGLRVGTTTTVLGHPTLIRGGPRSGPVQLTVVGVYRQEPSPSWFSRQLAASSGTLETSPPGIKHGVWLTDRETFEDARWNVDTVSSSAGFVIRPADVGVDDMLAMDTVVSALSSKGTSDVPPVDVNSGLLEISGQIQDQIDQSRVTVPLLMAQLGLLAVIVLWLILLAITEQRRPEVALATLRGRGRRGARGLLLAELLPVTLAGVVPGAVLALLASWVARSVVLPGAAPFELQAPFVLALLLSAAVLAAVTVVAVARIAREPVATLLRRVPPRRASWGLGVADALVIAGCGGVVVVFATGGLTGPVALAAPGLLAVVVGLVLAHLTTPTAALLGRRLLRRGRVRAGVSVLDAARSPATRRIVAVVTLATALAVFAADARVVGERNRATAAEQEAGAPAVVGVSGTDLTAVRAALADVDPDGRLATPVLRYTPPNRGSRTTLAVLPDQFRRIALFPGGAPSDAVWARLAAPDVDPIEITGTQATLQVSDSTLKSVRSDGKTPQPVAVGLDLEIVSTGETLHTQLGTLAHPTDATTLQTYVSCRNGCYVLGAWLGTLPGASLDGQVRLGSLSTEHDTVTLGPAGLWRDAVSQIQGSITAKGAGDDLVIKAHGDGNALLTLPHTWVPGVLPALVAGPLPADSTENRFTLAGVDGEDQAAARAATVPRVPASPADTSVVNLDAAERARGISPDGRLSVWLAKDDPALIHDVTAALNQHGVEVGTVTREPDVRNGYDESTPAWSLGLAATVGAAAVLIALLVLLVSAASTWRLRARDLAALRMAGVTRRSVGRMSVTGQLTAVLVGVVAGTVTGLYGAHLALPIVPLFAETPGVSTLDLSSAWGAAAVAAVGTLVVLSLSAVAIGRAMARRAELQRLRETM